MFYDSKYDVDEETAALPSAVEFFPDMDAFLADIEAETNPTYDRVILSDWAKRKLSTLQSMLQEKQFARDAKFFGSRYDTTKFSRTILYRLANDVFGYNGWSTSIQSCLLQELPVEDEGRHSARCVVEIRLILKDNTFKDATGVADSVNMPYKYMCYQTAKKKAVTEAMKNAITSIPLLCVEEDARNSELDEIEDDLYLKYGI